MVKSGWTSIWFPCLIDVNRPDCKNHVIITISQLLIGIVHSIHKYSRLTYIYDANTRRVVHDTTGEIRLSWIIEHRIQFWLMLLMMISSTELRYPSSQEAFLKSPIVRWINIVSIESWIGLCVNRIIDLAQTETETENSTSGSSSWRKNKASARVTANTWWQNKKDWIPHLLIVQTWVERCLTSFISRYWVIAVSVDSTNDWSSSDEQLTSLVKILRWSSIISHYFSSVDTSDEAFSYGQPDPDTAIR